jgi:hypothetical protein
MKSALIMPSRHYSLACIWLLGIWLLPVAVCHVMRLPAWYLAWQLPLLHSMLSCLLHVTGATYQGFQVRQGTDLVTSR